ncbi:pseudouridine-5'-phosphate glycosidase [Microbacterium sp. APC 3898]|jgi:pseudouridine-5'-phosphate glycosidase|uniref:Pseudouridine-5'-phosphate glycosidase n=2 Tax=Planococcus TaxID=1372 RepID=A0ABT7ZP11_9BACL|nr:MULTISPECIES: pseudouridine-5'-phosphate glycosidase [Terrabacteria group]MBD8016610.1 pseudouridine-5'-phosphate glycosidase [Planococcus wigleyi]MDN3428899.1 pseudouridine-5'-phosphate glycosidase [Planococcus sp. APC 4016]MDN3439704.1 pseudouridine-5'-phosphate glycosidase [Planococcus sp. APC 3900]MDN3500659.1 pseudouridine-5'-phosphate glycosidase [Microbacterium sp. APC 3898]
MTSMISYSTEVQQAMEDKKPIVALESTIISHGMPYPQNVETARVVEQIIRDNGAVPATIAIMDGKIKIGLSDEELEVLGNSPGVSKVSRRDIGQLIATKKIGATTVAATMICAELAGIRVFATGGIGGVHRGAETTMDISADLEELSNTGVAVVCAGAKSILDIGLTLEYLETKGVPVIGYQTDDMPAFYTRSSGFDLTFRSDDAAELAEVLKAKWDLGITGGAVIANPIPAEHALEDSFINGIITQAMTEANENGISGKEVTPFLLGKVKELTEGKSLVANIELVKHNAKVGAELAVAYNKL